jgi:HSP20 family molecular chaperone IbpA
MAPISSVRPPTAPPQVATLSPSARATSRTENSEQKRARELENEASRRIQEAESRVREQQRASEAQIDALREDYSERMDVERSRQEGALIEERNEGQERISELKRKQREELSAVRREGEQQLEQVQKHYRDTTYRAFRDGEKNLKELQSKNALTQSHELTQQTQLQEQARLNQGMQMTLLKDHHDQQIRDLNQTYQGELERMREKTGEATQLADESYTRTFKDLSQKQNQLLKQLDSRTARQLEALRNAHSERLAAYDTRAEDQFYRMKTLNASLEERDDSYIIRAQVPEHERKNLSVSVQGSTVTLTNQRRSQESTEAEAGRKTSTASYQIITESFPLVSPVDGRAVTREFDGDQFIVRIPKKTTYQPSRAPAGAKNKPGIDPLENSRPRFPENLPVDQNELARKITESRLPDSQTGKRDRASATYAPTDSRLKRAFPGSGTLS